MFPNIKSLINLKLYILSKWYKMDITKNYNEKELTVTVKDKIDTVTAPDFENEIMDEIGNFDSLIIDFTDLEYISSAGLRVLVKVEKTLKPQGISSIIKVNDTIKEILILSGFNTFLNIQ